MPDLSVEELDSLRKTVEKRYTELLHDLHHAVTYEYKAGLRKEIVITERLCRKLSAEAPQRQDAPGGVTKAA